MCGLGERCRCTGLILCAHLQGAARCWPPRYWSPYALPALYELYEHGGACEVRSARRELNPKLPTWSRDGLEALPRLPQAGTQGYGLRSRRRAELLKAHGGQVVFSPALRGAATGGAALSSYTTRLLDCREGVARVPQVWRTAACEREREAACGDGSAL